MKVSVLIVTYNHEKYISQALDGVLAQEVNFEYEIVVGEDCSTDSNRNILLEYHKKYPHKIRLLLNEKNQGACENFVRTFTACSGDYIAYLDGDDYWTSPNKLQKQIDFLDAHPECTICFHPVKVIYDNNTEYSSVYPPAYKKTISTIDDLVRVNFIPSCSAVFRGRLFDAFPEWYFTLKVGDWPLHILNAQHGDIGLIDEIMAVYRLHSGGVWSREKNIKQIEITIQTLNAINEHLKYRYDRSVKSTLSKLYYGLARSYDEGNYVENAKTSLLICLRICFPCIFTPVFGIMALFIKLYLPKIYYSLRFLQNKIMQINSSLS